MNEEKRNGIKTLKEWEKSGKNWDNFCKPGDLVDEDVYWYFLKYFATEKYESRISAGGRALRQ